jgi:hypothetical protein
VYDNDTISGPKKGVSQTLTLKVHSREQEHQNLEQLQEEVAAAVLDSQQTIWTWRSSYAPGRSKRRLANPRPARRRCSKPVISNALPWSVPNR